ERVAVRGQLRERLLDLGRRRGVELEQPVRDHELGCLVAEVGAQASGPALELGERARELLPAGLGELDLVAVRAADLEVAEALAHEQLLELRLLLEVEL